MYYDGNVVYKFISNVYFSSYDLMLDRVAIHNKISPKVPLTVVGYGVNDNGEYGIVVKQPFVQAGHLAESEIQRYIENLGFTKVKGLISTTEYTTDLYYIGDMHDENAVLTPDGHIALIDIDGRLNTPELGYGGKWTIPQISFTEESVNKIDRIMDIITPTEVSRQEYERRFSTAENMLSEQLQETGRYEGFVTLHDQDSNVKSFAVQVDPEDDGKLLCIPCEAIALMLDQDQSLNNHQKEILAQGQSVKKNGKTLAFDIDTGIVKPCKPFITKICAKKEQAAPTTHSLSEEDTKSLLSIGATEKQIEELTSMGSAEIPVEKSEENYPKSLLLELREGTVVIKFNKGYISLKEAIIRTEEQAPIHFPKIR